MNNANGRGRLIYGCMGLGGSWDGTSYGAAEIDQAAAVIESAQGIGIGLFDHADIYRSGKSEAVFGEVLVRSHGLREKIQLQTKCGIRLGERGLQTHYDLSREAILERVNESLKRLQTEYVDVLLLHRPDPLMDARKVADAVGQLMAEGKVRQLGVSNMSGAQIAYLQDRLETPVVANQLEMSLLKRDWLESTVLVNHPESAGSGFPHGTLEHCMDKGIELQAYGSLAQGRYTGAGAQSDAETATAAMLQRLAAEKHTTVEAVLLGWLMKHPARISPVVGNTNLSRIGACADAADVAAQMSRAEWYGLWMAARGSNIP
ncbi:putative oxidoreductase [Paenarthrobacter nicotinovorans]|uniref:aldo/keto reductase n=1 Tax=Paenarthrobacter nicotinovorans TaxID=29320 RepID=UPI00278A3CCD|nr:aldo/keto reductase [Paenarthrobacter nicotinovorans]MDP9935884.1 putative oxidoreductase [Paenarthrobacter nicotinovorans]